MPPGRPSRATVYARLDHALDELRTHFGGLPSPAEAEHVWSDIWHLEAHHSTALEGNTLVLREVEALLERGRVVGAKPLREYLEVRGYSQAASWVYAQATGSAELSSPDLVTVQEVRRIHHLAMGPVWAVDPHPDATESESPGNFRRHDIRAFPAGMTPPSWPLVDAEIDGWVQLTTDLLQRPAAGAPGPLPEVIARIHNRFERVHPFLDGNGRTGRLLLNLILVRLGHPPVIVLKRQREAYLAAMQKSDADDFGPLGELLARAMIDNLNRFILPSVAGPARLVPLASLANGDFSLVALRAAARRGRLDASLDVHGQWLSTRRAVSRYARSRSHTRRPGHSAT